ICRVRRAKERVPVPGHLLYIDLEHVFLNLGDNAPENVGDRKPKEYADVSGQPDCERVLETIKDSKTKYQGAENCQNYQVKCPESIDAKRCSFVNNMKDFRH